MKKTQVLLRVNLELKDKLKIVAKKLGLTVNGLIIQILWDYVNNN